MIETRFGGFQTVAAGLRVPGRCLFARTGNNAANWRRLSDGSVGMAVILPRRRGGCVWRTERGGWEIV